MSKFTLQNPGQKPATPEPTVDPAALEAFAAGARERRGANEELPPWEKYDPSEKPRYNVTIRMNNYELEILRYLSKIFGISQHKILNKHLMPLLKQVALEEFEVQRSK